MTPELTQAIIQKLKKHKILLGLTIVGMLLIFVGGVVLPEEPANANKSAIKEAVSAPESQAAPANAAKTANPADEFGPALASQFVTWWVQQAMDYSPSTAKAHHDEAFKWMTPEAAQGFQSSFWTPTIESEIASGQVTAAFQPISVQSVAVNPDGTIVVSVTGSLVMQSQGGAPATQQIAADYLVMKDARGLRIAGLYNRSNLQTASPTY